MAKFLKDPDARLDYTFNWADWLKDDAIQLSSWFIAGPTAEVTIVTQTNTASVATVWLEGGVSGNKVTVTNRITTIGNRIDDRSMEITIMQK